MSAGFLVHIETFTIVTNFKVKRLLLDKEPHICLRGLGMTEDIGEQFAQNIQGLIDGFSGKLIRVDCHLQFA